MLLLAATAGCGYCWSWQLPLLADGGCWLWLFPLMLLSTARYHTTAHVGVVALSHVCAARQLHAGDGK